MKGKRLALGLLAALGGCTATPPVRQVVSTPESAAPPVVHPASAPRVALLEPYLVAVNATAALPAPSPLSGRILSTPPSLPVAPLAPAPPTQTVPMVPPSAPMPKGPAPVAKVAVPPAVVRLLEEERARSVDDARRRLAAAAVRASQTAAEAKKQWSYVKEGFVAQKQAENADAAAKDAATEQADAQKTLDAAQQRQRDARRDLQAAFALVGFTAVRLEKPLPAYRPMPFTYRLSVLGDPLGALTVENGTLGRALPSANGEGGAWIVRCADPWRVRVRIGASAGTVMVRALPVVEPTSKGTI